MSKFKEIGGSKVYRGWKNWAEGEFIQGVLVGQSTDNYGKPNWHIQVVETNIEDQDEIIEGATVGLNSCGGLDFKLAQVEEGESVYIEYDGTTALTKGKFKGKDCHNVIVKVMEADASEAEKDDLDSYSDL